MRQRTLAHAVAVALGLAALCCTPPARAALTDEQVKQAIADTIEKLYKLQNKDGTWDGGGGDAAGGKTALVTYALLSAGESYQSPKLKNAIEYLAVANLTGTYAVSFRSHVWSHLPPRFARNLKQDTLWLTDAIGGGPEGGGYGYNSLHNQPGSYDNSNTQYGVLGVWEGAKRDIPIPKEYWNKVGRHFLRLQKEDGGWNYTGNDASYGSMTAAGLACLFIVREQLYAQDFRNPGAAEKHPIHANIMRGLDWFDAHFQPDINPQAGSGRANSKGWMHYYLVAVERIALASGYKYFGGRDWYAEGAEYLMANPGSAAEDLAFTLIFLSRGRVPVFMNKLRIHGRDWNNRPDDARQLTNWMSDQVERRMNWQVVDLSSPPHEWLDAPLLYYAGHEPLTLSTTNASKLRRFMDLGGMMVTTADTGSEKFTQSVHELYKKLYPKLELKKVEPTDDLLGMVFPVRDENFEVWSLHNGVRHLAIHFTSDASWKFHSRAFTDPACQVMANAYFYATEKGNQRPRLAEHYAPRKLDGAAPRISIARVKHPGEWNPEPLAWEVQSNKMFNAGKADLTIREVDVKNLGESKEPFAHLTGIAAVQFTEPQLQAIKKYAENGGLLLIETTGGNGEFSQSLAKQLAPLFSDATPQPVPLNSGLVLGASYGGEDLIKVDYRFYAVLKAGAQSSVRLKALTVSGEPRILFSDDDLTAAMLNRPLWGVYGYSGDSAYRIITNLILRAHRRPIPGIGIIPTSLPLESSD